MVQRSPQLSTCRIASCIGVSRVQVWWTLHEENLHPYHDHKVHLEPGDTAQCMDLCHWITAHPQLLSVILFTDEVSFTWDGIHNSWNMHTWSHDNPHETVVTKFQRRFSVNVWCGLLGNKLIGPSVFDNNVTGNIWSLPEEWVARFVGRHPINDNKPNVLPTWRGSATLLSAHEIVLKWLFPWQLVRSWWTRCMATKVARSYTSWLLSLGPHEDISVWNMKLRSIQEQHCAIVFLQWQNTYATILTTFCLLLHRKVHSNWRRTLWTITVKQVLYFIQASSRLIQKSAVDFVKWVLQYCWKFMCHVKCLEPLGQLWHYWKCLCSLIEWLYVTQMLIRC